MRATGVSFVGPRRVELTEVAVAPPGPGEVLVRTLFSGISSGTEMLAYRGEIDPGQTLDDSISSLEGSFSYPFRYGYSCVGVVERSGADLEEGAVVFAFHPHQDLFVVSASEVQPLVGCDPRRATLLPHVETALQITLDAGPVAHDHVVVQGLGAIGLLTAVLLARAGAQVLGIEPQPWRRRVAESLGLRCAAPDDAPDEVEMSTQGTGVPLVVEASGDPGALPQALDLLAHEGTALVVSWYGSKPVALPLGGAFHRRRLTIRSTQVSTIPACLKRTWTIPRRRRVVASLLSGLPLDALATHTFPLERAPEAFQAVDRGEEGLLHAALGYRSG